MYDLITPLAPSSGAATSIVTNLLQFAAVLGGGLIALMMIYQIVKDIVAYKNGSGGGSGGVSLGSIVKKVCVLLVAIGIIFLVANGWTGLGEKAKTISEKGINLIDKSTNEIIP